MTKTSDLAIRCPACGGLDVRKSYSRGILDAFMGSFHKLPFRCRGCTHRFYRYVAPKPEEEIENQTGSREEPPE